MTMQNCILPPHSVLGSWTYRSFINEPDISKDFNALEFGRGELIIEEFAPEVFSGRLSCTVRFRGVGDTKDSYGQVYDCGIFYPDVVERDQSATHFDRFCSPYGSP